MSELRKSRFPHGTKVPVPARDRRYQTLRNEPAAVLALPGLAPGSRKKIRPNGRCLASHNPRAGLQCEYRYDRASDRRYASGTWSRPNERRWMVFGNRHSIRKGRDVHNRTIFSCSFKGNRISLKVYIKIGLSSIDRHVQEIT